VHSLQKAINLLNELKALQAYAMGFSLADYSMPRHAKHLQENVSRLLIDMFYERFGNQDRAAANAPLLLMYKQIGVMKLEPEKLKEMMHVLLPAQVAMLEMKIAEMIKSGDEEVDPGPPDPAHPINN
jgi:hypothetical protein